MSGSDLNPIYSLSKGTRISPSLKKVGAIFLIYGCTNSIVNNLIISGMKKLFMLICFTLAVSVVSAQSISDRIESVSGLVAYWDFSGEKDKVLLSE